MKITNTSDISLALAVWLLHDEYDHVHGVAKYISATTLMKPLRHIILAKRIPPELQTADVTDFIATGMGKSLHDSIEKAWVKGAAESLRLLGYPEAVIKRVRCNPTDDEIKADPTIIPIYLEQRMMREHAGYTVGGKFDLVTEGIVQDAKSTSAFTWVYGGREDDYVIQLSLYRWIDQKKVDGGLIRITEDFGRINFIFTDWQKSAARTNPNYPQKRVEHKDLALLTLEQTEKWVSDKLALISKHQNTPEPMLPDCTDDELWLSAPTFKYYADASKTDGKSTKNFDSLAEANAHHASKGGKGIVKTFRSEPKRCGYCAAFPICSQKDRYFAK